ncbi:MAG: hypothetical protein ACK5MP_14200 [Nostocoides sp.]
MTDVTRAVLGLLELPGVAAAIDQAREACTRLRWHEGLRRRTPEAAAESRIRGAWASAELDGAPIGLPIVRERVVGLAPWPVPPDPVDAVVHGSVAATMEAEHVEALIRCAPRQVMARLHIAAAARLVPKDELGRPRQADEGCREFTDLPPAPDTEDLMIRLTSLADLLADAQLPVGLVAALAHAEVATARPFTRGNGVVARALERAVIHAGGLDPTGVAVPEAGYRELGGAAYVGALAGYASGTATGVASWLRHASAALSAGAAEGERVAGAVRLGRLSAQ